MTRYTQPDLAQDWEFKILRSSTRAFKNPDSLRRVLEEEGRAGWVLVEKFDNTRIRLKRPASAGANDGLLNFDAYRTQLGMSETALGLSIAGGLIGVAAAIILVIFLVAH